MPQNKTLRSTKQQPHGFTLIELLVVIAIIAILAAILFPVFARARENARRASCQSQEKQMALGLIQYTQDYDERFPIYTTATPPGFYCSNVCWSEQIQPYVKNWQLFRCPSRPKDYDGATDVNGSVYQLTYGIPNQSGAYNPPHNLYAPSSFHIARVVEPARTWMIVETKDSAWYDGPSGTRGYGFYAPYLESQTKPESSAYFDSDRHLEGSNVAFVDGHVKWIKSGTGDQWIYRCPANPGGTGATCS
jgi:prepilin-type N-terminal cleavage/methylation domain-containing protein/prepilin-type processing-associated H-X9-DG protein